MNAIHTRFVPDEGFVLIQVMYHQTNLLRKAHKVLDA
jgi:hypothetical protein